MTKVFIEGMSCQHCVNRVKAALEGIDGITDIRVSLEDNMATFEGSATNAQLISAVEDAGFEVTKIEED